ncbi:hypothetical protein [Leucothrix arctica]|uniref:Competence protein ComEA n=1 Tax=Leucothrix arctica TaxID=1481894 RepID=A0A317CAN6_9GAMM|nr:hypothetical protein [Leucothrix arctica]PWQ93142.1 hypothetical protein DKT75_20855 [Leucothrix arctica]
MKTTLALISSALLLSTCVCAGETAPTTSPTDFGEAARKLNVTKKALIEALQDAGAPNADFSKVSDNLGVSIYALKAVLPKRLGQ